MAFEYRCFDVKRLHNCTEAYRRPTVPVSVAVAARDVTRLSTFGGELCRDKNRDTSEGGVGGGLGELARGRLGSFFACFLTEFYGIF